MSMRNLRRLLCFVLALAIANWSGQPMATLLSGAAASQSADMSMPGCKSCEMPAPLKGHCGGICGPVFELTAPRLPSVPAAIVLPAIAFAEKLVGRMPEPDFSPPRA